MRKRLDIALTDLLMQRSFAELRVTEIVRKAKMARATFYAHFASKEEQLHERLLRVLRLHVRFDPHLPALVDATPLYEHLQAVPKLGHSLLRGKSAACVEAHVSALLREHVLVVLLRRAKQDRATNISAHEVVDFVVNMLLKLIYECINGTSFRPEQLQRRFDVLVGGAIQATGFGLAR